mgnify:CR=1 FL=1
MRMVSIASGSSGNCIYIGSDNTHVLVDAGISNKRIEMGLNDLGLNARELDGILITHEHSDHIKGLGVLARKYGTPIYSTKETLEEIQDSKSLGEIPEDLMHPITPDVDFMVGDLEVKPFRIDHDAANPVAYRVQNEKRSVAVATDMGHYSQYIIDICRAGCDFAGSQPRCQNAGGRTVSVLPEASYLRRLRTPFQ